MCAPYKKIILLLFVALYGGLAFGQAADLRWIHLGTLDAGQMNLAINDRIAYRKMSPGNATSWSTIPAGLYRFQIGTETNPGNSFELQVEDGQKIVIVSVSDKEGNLQSRSVLMNMRQGEVFVLNMIPGVMIKLPENDQKAIFGKGFRVTVANEPSVVSFADSEGLEGRIDLSGAKDTPHASYLAILSSDDDDQPKLAVLRDRDSLFEMSSQSIEIDDELLAVLGIISEGNVGKSAKFDPSSVNWEDVRSRIFWLNLMIGRDPCRLEIDDFPAMRRMQSGRGSGFVNWPAGDWSIDVVIERTNEKIISNNISLANRSSMGLISSGGGQFPHRLITLQGTGADEDDVTVKPQIRFVNALPDGRLRSIIQPNPEPLTITLEPGEASDVVRLTETGFPGAKLDLSLGDIKHQNIINIPPIPTIPAGDWVIIIHLDQESFDAPVLTWVEMGKGSITFPSKPEED